MEAIIKYFVDAIKAILAYFGIVLDEETESNIDSMIGGIKDFEPSTPAGSLDI